MKVDVALIFESILGHPRGVGYIVERPVLIQSVLGGCTDSASADPCWSVLQLCIQSAELYSHLLEANLFGCLLELVLDEDEELVHEALR